MDTDFREAFDARLPVALARLHWATSVGDVRSVEIVGGTAAAPVSLEDLITGAGFEVVASVRVKGAVRATLSRVRTLPDTVAERMRALMCGLNPSVVAADAGFGYAGPTNRFWPAAMAAGLVTRPRDPLHALEVDGIGFTDLVKRATPGAAALARAEYEEGAARVGRLVAWLQPEVVVFVGLAGWRAAVDRRAVAGWQPQPFGGRPAYVMPSTSGLNANSSRAELEDHLRVAAASGAPRLI